MDSGGEHGAGPYLEGQLLVAMPTMADPRFAHTVIYMCAHSEDGAMGLVVNKLLESLSFSDLLEQLEIEPAQESKPIPVHFGGPVEAARGFVLHSTDYTHEATMQVDDGFSLTATIDVLKAMAEGRGPRLSMLALGYAGWAPGQLDREIQENGLAHRAGGRGAGLRRGPGRKVGARGRPPRHRPRQPLGLRRPGLERFRFARKRSRTFSLTAAGLRLAPPRGRR